jgi:C4-dicarboxylate transporter DctM subunit
MSLAVIGAGFIFLALLGAPLFVVLGGLALIAFAGADIGSEAVIVELYRLASNPHLLTIPLFTFAGYLMAESRTADRLVGACRAAFGWMPGGLAIVVLLTCAFFTTFTGASGVTIIALGGLLMPVLISEKYPEDYSLGVITASGSIGLLFPPSLPIILYGIVAQTDIDKLFLAGILPGCLMISILGLWSVRVAVKAKVVRTPFEPRVALASLWMAKWEVVVPVIIIVGIYGGFVTIGEASAITAAYLLVVEVFIYKDLSLKNDIPRVIRESMLLVGAILVILGVALGLTNYMVDAEVPKKIFDAIRDHITEKWMFLLALNCFLIVVGCLMDIFSAIIVVVPLITPIAAEFGVDPVHLGIIFLANLELGYLTPPVGINLFISTLTFKQPIFRVYRTAMPFLFLLFIALMIITYVPELSLWLVGVVGG